MERIEVYAEQHSGDVLYLTETASHAAGDALHVWRELAARYPSLVPRREVDSSETERASGVVTAGAVTPNLAPPDDDVARIARNICAPCSKADPHMGLNLWREIASQLTRRSVRDSYMLGMTLNGMLLPHARLREQASIVRTWCADFPGAAPLLALAEILERADGNPRIVAIGLHYSVLGACQWDIIDAPTRSSASNESTGWPTDSDGADDDENLWRPYNTHRDFGHWYLADDWV